MSDLPSGRLSAGQGGVTGPGAAGGYLDDLFIDPSARGSGAADALLAQLRQIAAARGGSVVRWITAEDNYRGRAKDDQHAARTTWITYDMTP